MEFKDYYQTLGVEKSARRPRAHAAAASFAHHRAGIRVLNSRAAHLKVAAVATTATSSSSSLARLRASAAVQAVQVGLVKAAAMRPGAEATTTPRSSSTCSTPTRAARARCRCAPRAPARTGAW